MPFILPGWRKCNMLEKKKTISVNWEKLNLPKMWIIYPNSLMSLIVLLHVNLVLFVRQKQAILRHYFGL